MEHRNACACSVLLSEYSPDLDPIERLFAKLKHLGQKVAARNLLAGSETITMLPETYTQTECSNYFWAVGDGPA